MQPNDAPPSRTETMNNDNTTSEALTRLLANNYVRFYVGGETLGNEATLDDVASFCERLQELCDLEFGEGEVSALPADGGHHCGLYMSATDGPKYYAADPEDPRNELLDAIDRLCDRAFLDELLFGAATR